MLLSQDELLTKMQDITEKYVECFKSDFYDYDVNTVEQMKPGDARIWIVRDAGTWFDSDPALIPAFMEQGRPLKYYLIERTFREGKVYECKELTREQVKRWCRKAKKDELALIQYYLQNGSDFTRDEQNGRVVKVLEQRDDVIWVPLDNGYTAYPATTEGLEYILDNVLNITPLAALTLYDRVYKAA